MNVLQHNPNPAGVSPRLTLSQRFAQRFNKQSPVAVIAASAVAEIWASGPPVAHVWDHIESWVKHTPVAAIPWLEAWRIPLLGLAGTAVGLSLNGFKGLPAWMQNKTTERVYDMVSRPLQWFMNSAPISRMWFGKEVATNPEKYLQDGERSLGHAWAMRGYVGGVIPKLREAYPEPLVGSYTKGEARQVAWELTTVSAPATIAFSAATGMGISVDTAMLYGTYLLVTPAVSRLYRVYDSKPADEILDPSEDKRHRALLGRIGLFWATHALFGLESSGVLSPFVGYGIQLTSIALLTLGILTFVRPHPSN